ncbi:MAG: NfeD family protein [Bacteroidota bacterium]
MEIFSNPAVIWFLIGLAFLLIELALPGLVIFFFGIGAWITALVCAFTDLNLNWQILIFMVTSLLGLVLLRKYIRRKFFDKKDEKTEDQLEEFIGRPAKALEDFVDGEGYIEFKGSQWKAEAEQPVKKGDSLVITAKDSLKLIVKHK